MSDNKITVDLSRVNVKNLFIFGLSMSFCKTSAIFNLLNASMAQQ